VQVFHFLFGDAAAEPHRLCLLLLRLGRCVCVCVCVCVCWWAGGGVTHTHAPHLFFLAALAVAGQIPPDIDVENVVNIHEYCDFSGNEAGTDGGGLYIYYSQAVDIKGTVTFDSNSVSE
jgi:hypothetical protein